MQTSIKFTTKGFRSGISKLGGRLSQSSTQALIHAAQQINAKARNRAPTGFTGGLIESAKVTTIGLTTESSRARSGSVRGARGFGVKAVRFGFEKRYAEIMDRGWKTSIIRPKKARFLWIPLTREAALQGPRKSRRRSTGRVSGRIINGGRRSARGPKFASTKGASKIANFGSGLRADRTIDFVFARFVRTRKPVKGSKIGPNRYFSGTLDDVTKDGSLERFIGKSLKQGLGT